MDFVNGKEIAKAILHEIGNDYIPSPLETYQQDQQRRLLQIQSEVDNVEKDFINGMEMLLEKLSTMEFEEAEKEDIPSFDSIIQAFTEPNEDMQKRMDKNDESLTMQEIAGLSDSAMTKLFHAAWELVNKDTNSSAPIAFGALVTLNPNIGLFWRGLGESFEEVGKLDKALSSYIMAMQVDPYNIKGYLRAATIAKFQKKQEIVDEIINLARQWLKKGNDKEAITSLSMDIKNMEELLSFMK